MSKLLALSLWLVLPGSLVLSGTAHAAKFTVHVDAANAQGHIRQQFVNDADGCHGDNVSPTIAWNGAPKGTKAFAVTVYDPDASGGWWHWVVLDIPEMAHELKQGATLPPGAYAVTNSYGHERWDGPCPPKGPAHHYVFTVYALDTAALGLPADTAAVAAKADIKQHAIGKASVTYTYGR